MKNKIISIIIVCILVLLATSCDSRIPLNSKALARAVLEELTDDEESNLKDRFSSYILNKIENIDEQIISAKKFLHDVKPDIDYILVGGEEWIDEGKLTLKRPSIIMRFVDKKTNDSYRLSISMYTVNAEDPSRVGIQRITIEREKDKERVTIGD
jgi:hypothetical protein